MSIIVEDLTDPKKNKELNIKMLASNAYQSVFFSSIYLKFHYKDVIKVLLIAANSFIKCMQKMELVTEDDLEKINKEVEVIVDQHVQELEMSDTLKMFKQCVSDCFGDDQ
jgi:hypothetical protein